MPRPSSRLDFKTKVGYYNLRCEALLCLSSPHRAPPLGLLVALPVANQENLRDGSNQSPEQKERCLVLIHPQRLECASSGDGFTSGAAQMPVSTVLGEVPSASSPFFPCFLVTMLFLVCSIDLLFWGLFVEDVYRTLPKQLSGALDADLKLQLRLHIIQAAL